MVNLNKLLKVAAGRLAMPEENVHVSPPRPRRRRVSFADEVKDNVPTEASSNPSIPQQPRKNTGILKRNDHRGRECVIVGSSSEVVKSDLSKDEDDQEKLSKLSDLEKGKIPVACEETGSKLLRKREREDRTGSSSKEHPSSSKEHPRLVRSNAERTRALAELAKRRKDAAERSGRRSSNADTTELPTVSNSSLALSNEEDSSEFSSDEDNMSLEPPTLHEIMSIVVPRSKLVKWFMEPYFNELITGCILRVYSRKGNGEPSVYNLCEVLSVDSAQCNPLYEFESKPTYKYLNVIWGDGSQARLEMTLVSNSPPRKVEYDRWITEVKLSRGHIPTKEEMLNKTQAFQKIDTFVYSPAVVKQMVEEKRSSGWRRASIAAEKARLRRELELASDSDVIELKRIQARLQELEAASERSRGSRKKALVVQELNKKNLLANLDNLSRKHDSPKSSQDYDPFSRRWTRPGAVYVGGSSSGAGNPVSAAAEEAPAAIAPPPPADEAELVDTTAQVYEGSAVNVDASGVMATLEKVRKAGLRAGYLARKQQLEARIGVKVEDDGKSHPHAMSIEEYRRRRGLI